MNRAIDESLVSSGHNRELENKDVFYSQPEHLEGLYLALKEVDWVRQQECQWLLVELLVEQQKSVWQVRQ